MKILGLDTATRTASVAAVDGGVLRAERHELVTTHSDGLLLAVDAVLRQAGWTMDDVALVACGAGPGSFTGLRIGLGTAKGLCFGAGRELIMISSLAALARRALLRGGTRALALLDAHKSEVYAGLYGAGGHLISAEIVCPPAALAARLDYAGAALIGDGFVRYPELRLVGAEWIDEPTPRAEDVAQLAWARWQAGERDDLDSAQPRYLRASEAEMLKAMKS